METNTNTINLTTDKIVEVKVVDHDWDDNSSYPGGVLNTYYLVNPDPEKLNTLKKMIETRFDYGSNEVLSDEEYREAENFCDHIWENIEEFIKENFVSLNIAEVLEISY